MQWFYDPLIVLACTSYYSRDARWGPVVSIATRVSLLPGSFGNISRRLHIYINYHEVISLLALNVTAFFLNYVILYFSL